MKKFLLAFFLSLAPLAAGADGLNNAISQTTGAWTPADASGAALVFTGVSASYTKVGNMVFAYAQLTYPTTVNASQASIGGFPVPFVSAAYGRQCQITYSNAATTPPVYILPTNSSSAVVFASATGTATANSVLSGTAVIFICTYPAS